MIERHAGRMQVVCQCGFAQSRTYAVDEFDAMVSGARGEGFVVARVAGEWTHTCETCARPNRSQGRLI